MTVYTATPEMCHKAVDYGENLLPLDWPGKKFRLDDSGGRVRLVNEWESTHRSWVITQELAAKIRASAETEEDKPEEVKPDIVQQRDELQRLRDVVTAKEEELRTFKRRVAEVAMEYAERHDWCSTVAEALDELGLDVPTKEYTFTLSVIYRVKGTKESYGDPDTYALREYTHLDADVTMTADDWGDFEVEYVQHDVMDIEEVTE